MQDIGGSRQDPAPHLWGGIVYLKAKILVLIRKVHDISSKARIVNR